MRSVPKRANALSMGSRLRVSGLIEESIVDGPGLRFTVFTQGCPHGCRGCHNPQTHDFNGGYEIEIDEIFKRFLENPLLLGITFSGGEPFCQPEPLYHLGEKVKALGKTIVLFSGYTLEQLIEMSRKERYIKQLLSITDMLIDGPFVEELKDLELLFRGSSNQRMIEREIIEGKLID